jgi:hypothetical protein
VKALEAEGLNIREAGTHSRPSAEVFEFKPAPTSPIYPAYTRRSLDSPLRGRTNSWRGSTHSLASVDAGTQTEEEVGKSSSGSHSHSPEKKEDSPVVKETEHVSDSDDSDTPYDEHEHAEIETAIPVVTRARVVSVQKPTPPALPPRNPSRVSILSPEKELNDGFDQVDLNGPAEHTRHDIEKTSEIHHDHLTADHSQEEGHITQDGTAQGTDDDFHSIPSTPAERREGIPGSFE